MRFLGYNHSMNMNRMRKTENTVFPYATTVYASILFALHPLFMHRGYFDITEAKAAFYVTVSALYIISFVIFYIRGASIRFSRPGAAVFCFLLYFAVSTVSSVAFGRGRNVIIAADNRYQGIGMTLLYSLSIYFIAESHIWNSSGVKYLFYSSAAGLFLFGALGIMNYFSIDPFGVYRHMSKIDSRKFFSGIGNVDFISAYFSLFIPFLLFLILCNGKSFGKHAKAIFVLSFVTGLAALPTASSSIWIGLIIAVLFFPLLYMKLKNSRYLGIYAAGLIILLVAFLAILVLYNTIWKDSRSVLADYLVIDDNWGSDRGRLWRYLLNLYKDFTPFQKLIGGGSGCIAAYDENLRIFPDAIVDSAHNEYLNLLLNSGLIGLVSYVGFLLTCVINAVKSHDPYKYALLLGIISYMAQATVNIAQPMTTPLFITSAALLSGGESSASHQLHLS